MWRTLALGAVLALVVCVACEAAPPAVVTPVPSTPRSVPTLAGERPVAVAVAVGTPTATPALVGDYPTLVRPRVERVEQGLNLLQQHLGTLRTNPLRMAEQDWRNQAFGMLDELAAANRDLRALGVRVGPDASLSGEVTKLVTDLEFVVEEYRSALADDPDASHFARAGRAEKTTAEEVESILFSLRRPVGRAPTLTPAR